MSTLRSLKSSLPMFFVMLISTLLMSIAGCQKDETPVNKLETARKMTNPLPGQNRKTDIYWSDHGVPHIVADNWFSLGVGAGYVASEQNFCIIADQLLKVRGERAKYFGPGEKNANIVSDVGNVALNYIEDGKRLFGSLSPRAQQLIDGYAQGFNKYVFEHFPNSLPAPCTDARWIQQTTPQELLAYYLSLAERASGQVLLPALVNATPPADVAVNSKGNFKGEFEVASLPDLNNLSLGSNAWSLGAQKTESGRSILLGNPHFPSYGALRFYQYRLRIPGVYDVQGASIIGTPCIQIGFNDDLAWTHTVSKSRHFTLYQLELNPNNPLQYKYDDGYRDMTEKQIKIAVGTSNGVVPFVKKVFFTHYGPMIATPELKWDRSKAYTFRDANRHNVGFVDQWLDMGSAKKFSEFNNAFKKYRGTPWVNTIYADRNGNSLYIEGTPVPNLSPETIAAWKVNPLAQILYAANGSFLLQGNTSRDEWIGDGLTPFKLAPRLRRQDYVMNSNDSHWLTNENVRITGISPIYGLEGIAQSYRTRMSYKMLNDSAGDNALFNVAEVEKSFFDNRAYLWENLGNDLKNRCQSWPEQSLRTACTAMGDWNGRFDLDSKGEAPFREFASGFKPGLHQIPFNASDPLNTPSGLAAVSKEGDLVKQLFSWAVENLAKANLNPASTLSEMQFFLLPDFAGGTKTKIPYHGGQHKEGAFNVQDWGGGNSNTAFAYPKAAQMVNEKSSLTTEGYPIDGGASFILLVDFADGIAKARGLLTYSQSSDPNSKYFSDQNVLYAAKQLRDFPHSWDEVMSKFCSTKETLLH